MPVIVRRSCSAPPKLSADLNIDFLTSLNFWFVCRCYKYFTVLSCHHNSPLLWEQFVYCLCWLCVEIAWHGQHTMSNLQNFSFFPQNQSPSRGHQSGTKSPSPQGYHSVRPLLLISFYCLNGFGAVFASIFS